MEYQNIEKRQKTIRILINNTQDILILMKISRTSEKWETEQTGILE